MSGPAVSGVGATHPAISARSDLSATIVPADVPHLEPTRDASPWILSPTKLWPRHAPLLTAIRRKLDTVFTPQPRESYETKVATSYREAKAAVEASGIDFSNQHRVIFRELLAETRESVPFPNHIVHGNYRYKLSPEIIDIAPHEFELAKLIDKLQWVSRVYLIKGGGSATKRPELFSSRGRTHSNVMFMRNIEPVRSGSPAAALQSGNCGENAHFNDMLAQSLDQDLLNEMGIALDVSQLAIYGIGNYKDDHSYSVLRHAESPPLTFTPPGTVDSGTSQYWTFSAETDKRDLWSHDSHQLYPMVSRYDQSTYNELVDAKIIRSALLGQPSSDLNLGKARAIREVMINNLELGEEGIHKALREDFRIENGIRSKFLDRKMREQRAPHYAQVDKTPMTEQERTKFDQKVAKVEREIDRKFVKILYQHGAFDETWIGLCLPKNPAAVYRNRDTGELLAPRVPPQYLERTERIRWAHDVWKRLRPDRAKLLDTRLKLTRAKFDIPLAVEAIENMPFLGALAAARALNYTDNSPCAELTAGYARAFSSMEGWIARMHTDLSEPGLIDQIREVGLTEEVHDALVRVKVNLRAISDLMSRIYAESVNQPDTYQEAYQTISSILASPSWRQIDDLSRAFEPTLHRR